MARLRLIVLALCAVGALANPVREVEKVDAKVLQERQEEWLVLFSHIHEPITVPKCVEIASSWSLEKNLEHYSNITAVKIYSSLLENNWHLPRAVPFAVNEPLHAFEAMTLFHVLYSAKDYETFYKTAVYLRDIVNEGLFVYAVSVAIIYRHDTQGIVLPPIYEIFPSFFNNGEIMNTAQRIDSHGHHLVDKYPSTYIWEDNVVIKWNETLWPYVGTKNYPLTYFTNDYSLNALYYYINLIYPQWLGSQNIPGLEKDRRGELWWFHHKQLVTRYYMERLSNGLDEIPDITNIVKDGYVPGLLYHNGVPYPSRPNNYHLDQPELVDETEEVVEYERRIWDSIDKGFIVDKHGEHVNILTEEGIDILGRVIEANIDSPNDLYYKDFISIWKTILGNTHGHDHQYVNNLVPLVLPSALENYETSIRDPAFYMLWKHVLKLFSHWQKRMPIYKPEELAYPSVSIQKVDVDKLVTYFELTYMNVTNHLHLNEHERKTMSNDVSVLVQHPRLNHKPYKVRVHVKSDVAKTVVVKFFLAPKYDSKGMEIPLHHNVDNFFLMDQFTYDLTVGDCVITRESLSNPFSFVEWPSTSQILEKISKGQWTAGMSPTIEKVPHHLMLPKGKVGGMPFQFLVYIQEYRAPKVPYGSGFDPKVSLGMGSGGRFLVDEPFGFPVNRPLYVWQIKNIRNIWIEDVLIHHKHTPEIVVPHFE